MSKKSTPSYEAYCKCFAGVFKKHVQGEHRSFYTCYVRDAINSYVNADDERRGRLMEGAAREATVGAYIAKALLDQGWPESYILESAEEQQRRVNNAEKMLGRDFVEALLYAGYHNREFYLEANGLRYAWILDGSPDLIDRLDDDGDNDSDNYYDVVDNDYDDDY